MLDFKNWFNENADIRDYLKKHGYNSKQWRKIRRAVDRDELLDIPGVPDLPVWDASKEAAFPQFLSYLKELIPSTPNRNTFIGILTQDAIAETALQDLFSRPFTKKEVSELIETLREMKIYLGPPAFGSDIKIWSKNTPENKIPPKDKPFQKTRI